MQASPTRLKAKRQPLLRRGPGKGEDTAWDSFVPTRGHVLRRLRVIRRGLTVLLWTLPCMLVQSILLLLPGHAKVAFARLYWAGMCRAIGLDIRVIGAPAAKTPDGRPVIYVSNHSSWLDILVLGGRLEACFIAKDEIGAWPLIRQIARLGRTVYVRRARASIGRERDEMGRRLSQGDNLVLFPEGTTSDGSRVLPFRSAFLSVAELAVSPDGRLPIVQPVSVVYDRLAGLPADLRLVRRHGHRLAFLAPRPASRATRHGIAAHATRSRALPQPQGPGRGLRDGGRRGCRHAAAEPAGPAAHGRRRDRRPGPVARFRVIFGCPWFDTLDTPTTHPATLPPGRGGNQAVLRLTRQYLTRAASATMSPRFPASRRACMGPRLMSVATV